MINPIFLKQVVLKNYKSIKECSVCLGPLTFLVGQNGAGKSNFLDALRLVTESLNTSLEHALRERGGINEVRRRSSGHPTHFGIRLDWELPNSTQGLYAFRVGAQPRGGFEIQKEECRVYEHGPLVKEFYRVEDGALIDKSFQVGPPTSSDRLYLAVASGLAPFRPLYDALSRMSFYNLNPDDIREPQPPDAGEVLKRDGSNLASVLSVMAKENKEAYGRVVAFLSKVMPGVQGIEIKHVGRKETLEFRQFVGLNQVPRRFMAENMSDGTLRALGVLTALFQLSNIVRKRLSFVGIEEPAAAIHPGSVGVLLDGLRSASRMSQITVTSQSPELLDDKGIPGESILAVADRNGETRIAALDEPGRSAIRDRLYTAGELLRLNQIEPDQEAIAGIPPNQLDLFTEYRL